MDSNEKWVCITAICAAACVLLGVASCTKQNAVFREKELDMLSKGYSKVGYVPGDGRATSEAYIKTEDVPKYLEGLKKKN